MSYDAAINGALGFGLTAIGSMICTNAGGYYITLSDIRKKQGKESLAEYAQQKRNETKGFQYPFVGIGVRMALKKYSL
jgi:hypothetical protein